MRKVTNIITSRGTYIVVEHMGGYASINTKLIDEDGKLTKTLNGFEMNWSRELKQTIETTVMSDKVRDLMDKGMSAENAVMKVMERRVAHGNEQS